MVLKKRKRDGELTTWTPASQSTGSAPTQVEAEPVVVQEAPEPSPPRTTRSNPPRSTRYSGSGTTASAPKPPPAKKPRASRAKKAVTPPEPTPVSAPIIRQPSPVALPAHAYNFPQPGPSSQPVASRASTGALPVHAYSFPQPGPSSQPVASGSSAPPPAKKRRGKKVVADDNEPSGSQPEKRGAMFKPKCPQNIWDRVERVRTQRIFMIDRQRNGEELREEFSVLGSTGNVYTVTIDRTPRCNCPDASKGNHCKHILFIFLKVLQVSQESGFWYQKALLTSELQQIFANAPLAPNSVAHQHIRDAHARATGKISANAVAEAPKNKRIPGPDDDCPICYDGMHGVAEKSLTFCEECGNALHKECFQQWQGTAARNGKDLTCVWCRARWVLAPAPGAGGVAGVTRTMHGHGYLNLAGVSGISPVRDTSTYYHGPRRGQRYYGYNEYGA